MSLANAKANCTNLNPASSLPIINSLEEYTFLQQYAADLVAYSGQGYWTSYYLGMSAALVLIIIFLPQFWVGNNKIPF